MPVNVKISIDGVRLQKAIRGLTKASEAAVLTQVDFTPFERKALRFLKAVFPRSRKEAPQEFGEHLREGFQARAITVSSGFFSFMSGASSAGFELYHRLDNNPRARVVLDSVDEGTRSWDYFPTYQHVFPDRRSAFKRSKKGPFTTAVPGFFMHHKRVFGVRFRQKTYDYIRTVLMPDIIAQTNKEIKRVADHG
jgi:hypothetical protein